MTDLTLMTFASDPATVLPSLALLSHRVRVLPMDAASLVKMPENTILFLDARAFFVFAGNVIFGGVLP